ncbi:hypothetical protein NV381_35905 [Paenibacillus sp. N5-1-1-5]|uniref:Uncharacterized protein n=2 Tax=Paenibacillus radicis (ex Xue et al. 2023) TaxID=2972489 RepID=A0ABT1YTQ5_9BACL|nr:hypothetical protein [Paenibacillus radicis (ex Xue et al. 2023)]MCR8636572.1 hypothetical protein [Paenibacillus radicis (ex Xue et al. 2023)]
MKMRVIAAEALLALTMIGHQATVYGEPQREKAIEEALLQELHTEIESSLNSIYSEKYSQFQCARIVSINERLTVSKQGTKSKPVDAIHGAKYFEINVGLLRKNDEYVELRLKNDTASAQYYLVNYSKRDRPMGFSCL